MRGNEIKDNKGIHTLMFIWRNVFQHVICLIKQVVRGKVQRKTYVLSNINKKNMLFYQNGIQEHLKVWSKSQIIVIINYGDYEATYLKLRNEQLLSKRD